MHDVFPKFIVEGDNLIIGKCTFHKQLATDPKKVKGGGRWEWDQERKSFLLFGESDDFGQATAEDIKSCIEVGNVFFSYAGGRKITNHTFYFDPGDGIIKLN